MVLNSLAMVLERVPMAAMAPGAMKAAMNTATVDPLEPEAGEGAMTQGRNYVRVDASSRSMQALTLYEIRTDGARVTAGSADHALHIGGLEDDNRSALPRDDVVALELVQQPRHRLPRRPSHVRQFLMRQRHGKTQFRFAAGIGARPVQQQLCQPPRRRSGERQPPGVEKYLVVFASDDLSGVAADVAVMAEEFEEVAAADAADLAGLEGLGGDF